SNSDQDTVKILGNWTKPKFSDEILPAQSKLDQNGFEAVWNLNSLPKFEDSSRTNKTVGLTHLWVGSDYSKIEKAIKYGILFIALTFLMVFIIEMRSKIKIHPFQYGLIGISISLFYLLLLAISEVIGFDAAYAIATGAVTTLIGFYVHGFIKDKVFIRTIIAEQVLLSGFFYLLLSLEESAFLVGTLGLFMALAAFMSLTRKFDWYSNAVRNEQ
ncbi:MAG: cell envelope integrity protein CreD, partial [Proteobacteria bacterium]